MEQAGLDLLAEIEAAQAEIEANQAKLAELLAQAFKDEDSDER